MDKIKIVFFDIDGTIIDMQRKEISGKMLQTLKDLQKNGIKICIATGRAPMAIPKFDGVEFDAFLAYNGSYCYDRDGMILDHFIPTEDVQLIIKNAKKLHRPLALSTRNKIEANGKDADLAEYFGFGKQEIIISDNFEKFSRERVYQIMIGSRKEEYAQVLENVKRAEITAWWDRAVDIIPAGGSKGVAVKKILEYYQIDQSEAMAFGDGNNDMEMLKAVGHGIAMGNASDELKRIAEDICGYVAEDGIYYYCKEHGLI